MKRCPICQSAYEDSFKVCPRDGTPLREGPASPEAETRPVGDPMIGTVIAGRFRITGKLGEGGMGSVYKAEHTKMDRLSAIKILSNSMAHDPDAVARFTREANMSSKIEHPNAIAIYDYGEAENGLVYLAMEYIDGHTLSGVLRSSGPMPAERTLKIAKQIGDALDAAHSLAIVHRDLKPDNVMIARKGNNPDFVKVLDFGIAKMAGEEKRNDLTQAGMVIGTPFYMSPEQVSGEKLDPRSDVYSFALIVYEMLTGRLPFGGDNTQAVMISRLTQQPVPLRQANPKISERVEFAVMRALARERDMRTPTAGQFVEELEDAILNRDRAATSPHQSVPTSGLETRQGAAVAPAPPPTAPPDAFATTPSAPVSQPRALHPTDRATPVGYPPPAQSPFAPPPAPAYAEPPAGSGGAGKVIAVVLALGLLVALGGGGIAAYVFKDRLFGGGPAAAGGPPAGGVSVPSAQPAGGPGLTGVSGDPVAAGPSGAGADAHMKQGAQHFAAGDFDKAAAEFRAASEIDPNNAKAFANLGAALVQAGKNSDAAAALTRAVVLDDSNAAAHYNLGLATFRMKGYRQAADEFRKAAALDASDPDYHLYAGYALDNLGDRAAAKSEYEKYLAANPSDQSNVNEVKRILAGQSTAPNGDEA